MRTVRLFVSSPTDVDFERQRIDRVVRRINAEYSSVIKIETVRWETAFYRAHQSFAREIPQAAECDIVICVFWARLGTPIPDETVRMPDGGPYNSGTAYELLTSLDAARTAGRPDVYVFRKTAPPLERIDQPDDLVEAQSQWRRLQAFLLRWLGDSRDRLTKPVYPFATTDEFEGKIADLLRQWVKAQVPEARERWSVDLRGSPFRGLAAFDAKHAEVFCGRDRKVARAIDELVHAAERGKPFLLIVGPSGAGKSSLMRAGLMPRLTSPGVVDWVDLWRTAVMRPSDGAGPFAALASALFVKGEADDPGGFGAALPELAERSHTAESFAALLESDGKQAIGEIEAALERIAERERARGGFGRTLEGRLLLLVDQLEDLFTADTTVKTRSEFARVLFEALESRRIWIATTLRADIYDRLIAERPFIALKDRGGHYDLAPPGPDELEEIIVKSAQVASLTYEIDPQTGESLDQRLLRDAEGEDILPLLEFTLNQLYERRERVGDEVRLVFSAYDKIGGLGGVIDQAGESAMEELSEAERAELPRLVRSLVVPIQLDAGASIDERALTIRTVPVAEVVTDERTEKLVDELVKARVLLATRQKNGSTSMLRLAHQRVLECWKRARSIIEAERTFFRVRDEVENQHRRWSTNGKRQELLVPAGRPLAEASDLVEAYGDELSTDLRSFISASVRRATRRQRLAVVLAFVFAAVAIFALIWRYQAAESYEAARGTIDSLIEKFAGGMKQTDGIPIDTVSEVLDTTKSLVGKLQSQNAGDPKLIGTQAAMQYQFASVYFEATSGEKPAAVAMAAADSALGLWNGLLSRDPDNAQWRWKKALSLDQIGDILRPPQGANRADKNMKPPHSNFCSTPHECYDQAHDLRSQLVREQPDNLQFRCGLSLSSSRLGDEAFADDRYEDAQRLYDEGFKAAKFILSRNPSGTIADCEWPREMYWPYNKQGRMAMQHKRFDTARDAYRKELCIHELVAMRNRRNLLLQRDLAWNLDYRLADAEAKLGLQKEATTDYFAGLALRHDLERRDAGRERWTSDYAGALHRAAQFEADKGAYPLAYALAVKEVEERTRMGQAKQKKGPKTSAPARPLKKGEKPRMNPFDAAKDLAERMRDEVDLDTATRVERDAQSMLDAREDRAKAALEDYRRSSLSCWAGIVRHPDISAAP